MLHLLYVALRCPVAVESSVAAPTSLHGVTCDGPGRLEAVASCLTFSVH